jgi:methenyltetrahydromethanopterin cyclohydrolase
VTSRPSDVFREARRVAIMDMGSNSWRVIVVEYVPGLSFKLVDEVQETVRLSEGMSELNVLRPAAMDRGARAAQIFAAFDFDFYRIDPMLFAPAEVLVCNLASGNSFRGGARDAGRLAESFGL